MPPDKQRRLSLPPKVARLDGPNGVEWERLGDIDVESVGRILACHLIIEHYLEGYLASSSPKFLNWEETRLTFGQKLDLLARKGGMIEEFGLLGGIRSLNAVRNHMSHEIEFKIASSATSPMRTALARWMKGAPVPTAPLEVIEQFTFLVCTCLGGAI
jgi:hypothetical protein